MKLFVRSISRKIEDKTDNMLPRENLAVHGDGGTARHFAKYAEGISLNESLARHQLATLGHRCGPRYLWTISNISSAIKSEFRSALT